MERICELDIAEEDDRALLVSPRGKRQIIQLRRGDAFHSQQGVVKHDDLIGKPFGREITSHLGKRFYVLRPSLRDELLNLERASQIIYPKEIAQILLRLDLHDGSRVIEAGTGSGALTMALADRVAPHGRVYSYERHTPLLDIAHRNLRRRGLEKHVQLIERDARDGFTVGDVDALFLDVRTPWALLEQADAALKPGGYFGALIPTTNQVSSLLAGLRQYSFVFPNVLEILERDYRAVASRLRPNDRMIGHTGFLVFARKVMAPSRDNDLDGELEKAE